MVLCFTLRGTLAIAIHPAFGRTEKEHSNREDWHNLRAMMPYVWEYRGRVMVALVCLVISKLAMVGVPLVLKHIVDGLDSAPGKTIMLPVMLLLIYGLLRFINSGFNELRDAIFARVRYHAMSSLSVSVLSHLHRLPLRYHLERNTGAISRDMERGTQSISSILNYLVFNIVPTAAEFVLVALILYSQYDSVFAGIIFFSVTVLHRFYPAGDRVAHALPPRNECARLERQRARDGQPDELRNGQVLQ